MPTATTAEANRALQDLKADRIHGTGVLVTCGGVYQFVHYPVVRTREQTISGQPGSGSTVTFKEKSTFFAA